MDDALGVSLVFLSSVVTLCVDTWGECVSGANVLTIPHIVPYQPQQEGTGGL